MSNIDEIEKSIKYSLENTLPISMDTIHGIQNIEDNKAPIVKSIFFP